MRSFAIIAATLAALATAPVYAGDENGQGVPNNVGGGLGDGRHYGHEGQTGWAGPNSVGTSGKYAIGKKEKPGFKPPSANTIVLGAPSFVDGAIAGWRAWVAPSKTHITRYSWGGISYQYIGRSNWTIRDQMSNEWTAGGPNNINNCSNCRESGATYYSTDSRGVFW